MRVDAPCLDCNEPMRVEMRDGEFLSAEPAGIVGHLNRPWKLGKDDLPFT